MNQINLLLLKRFCSATKFVKRFRKRGLVRIEDVSQKTVPLSNFMLRYSFKDESLIDNFSITFNYKNGVPNIIAVNNERESMRHFFDRLMSELFKKVEKEVREDESENEDIQSQIEVKEFRKLLSNKTPIPLTVQTKNLLRKVISNNLEYQILPIDELKLEYHLKLKLNDNGDDVYVAFKIENGNPVVLIVTEDAYRRNKS